MSRAVPLQRLPASFPADGGGGEEEGEEVQALALSNPVRLTRSPRPTALLPVGRESGGHTTLRPQHPVSGLRAHALLALQPFRSPLINLRPSLKIRCVVGGQKNAQRRRLSQQSAHPFSAATCQCRPFCLFLLTLRPDTARRTPTRRPQRAAPHPHATHAPATTSGCASSPGGDAMSAGGESVSLFSILSNSLRMSSKERAGVLLAVLDASLQVCAHAQPSR